MTLTPENPDTQAAIDAEVMAKAREAYHAPFRDAIDSAPVKEIIASIARAIQAAKDDAWQTGYLAGFNSSGEGWNGEVPFEGCDPLGDKYWRTRREADRRVFQPFVVPAHPGVEA